MLAKKSRLGRPPGRKAPHRPVLSTVLSSRVDPAFLQQVKASAKAAGRTVSEEVLFQAQQGYTWGAAHGTVATMLAEARGIVERTKKAPLEQTLRERGYTKVNAIEGAVWFEPGVHAPTWIIANDAVLKEMLEAAAVRALEKVGKRS